MAAMPLPLQLKSWKGCIAELMAQPRFRVSCKEMGVQAGNEVWDRPLWLKPTVYSSMYHLHAQRASLLLHLQTSVLIIMKCALAQLFVV